MTFEYFQVNKTIIRPIIPIILRSSTNLILYSGLIDFGSDHCVFGLNVARGLNIDLDPKDRIKFLGVGKDEVVGHWGDIELRIGSQTYKVKVIFADISDLGHGILGQRGFFDHFDVCLRYQKGEIEIKPKASSRGGKPLTS